MAKLYKAAGPRDEIELLIHADHATGWLGSNSFNVRFLGATPPDVLAVIPDYAGIADRPESVGLDPSYLADLVKVRDAIDNGRRGVRLEFGRCELDPVRVHFPGADEWTAVIMPCQTEPVYRPMRKAAPQLPPSSKAA